jgi:hypothetical protein
MLNIEATLEAIAILEKAKLETLGLPTMIWAITNNAQRRLANELKQYLRGE